MEYKISSKLRDMKPSAIREIFKSLADPTVISFAAGNPSPETFPAEKMAAIAQKIFRDRPAAALQYGITEGYAPLIEKVSARLKSRFVVGGPGDSTIITTGGQQGIDLVCKVMCDPGDVVICENPSFIGALNAFRANGARIVGVNTDSEGIIPEALEAALKGTTNVKLIYLIPTFHNPMGTTMSLKRREAVYDLARRYNVLILEDNPYGELRFAGEDVPTIKSLDADGRVVYCSSFSKILSPGMRVGFLCGPAAVIQKVVVAKQVNDVHTNSFFQIVCNDFIEEYDIDAHIAGIRDLYRIKCGHMLACMDAKFKSLIEFTRPEGGLFVWCTLPQSVLLDSFVKGCLERKVAVVPGTAFLPDESAASSSFRVNFSMPTMDRIAQGVDVCAAVARELMG